MTTTSDRPVAEDAPEADPTAPQSVDLAALWRDTQTTLAPLFEQFGWADDEIEQAQARHPDHADTLWHAAGLLRPVPGMPHTEFLYRAHARELLERVAAGADTRPGTDAEVCVICMQTSLEAPMVEAAVGLYGRCLARVLPDDIASPMADAQPHEEALHGGEIDDLERQTRQRVATRWARDRRLNPKEITCDGRHHGDPVTCRYATPTQPTLTD